MFGLSSASHGDANLVLDALSRSLAIIEFDPSGKILNANGNFCEAIGYSLEEIKGKHHSMFVEPAYARSPEYNSFWAKLGRGEFDVGEYRRIGKNGRDVWIKASYNPVKDKRGKVLKVVKQATDITAEKLLSSEIDAKMAAISRAQAVIEFTPAGEVQTANENFLSVTGYRLDEIQGRHHRMFVDPAYAQSADYTDFWRRLNAGEYLVAELRRVGKGGKEIWIQASYNPVFDLNGKVMKVVKFATDTTARVNAVNEIGKRVANLFRAVQGDGANGAFSFEALQADVARALAEVESAISLVATTTNAIQTGTHEISTAAEDLSRRTETQAASLEETAAALDEITSTVKKTAEDAAHARSVVENARKDAEHSGEVVGKAVIAMNAIEGSSRQVGQIIGVIDEIAFQTNLLALNAGVEAARAGEAGRGFAVVAQEVRGLAQRSAEAAKEIKNLIAASDSQVKEGVELVGETGRALERIVRHVTEINGIVAVMAGSAQTQATSLQEVNVAVNQMDQVTQQNAAMVEETAAASRSLAGEAETLREMIARFRMGDVDGGSAMPKRAPAKVTMLKTTGAGGAARKPAAKEQPGEWAEF